MRSSFVGGQSVLSNKRVREKGVAINGEPPLKRMKSDSDISSSVPPVSSGTATASILIRLVEGRAVMSAREAAVMPVPDKKLLQKFIYQNGEAVSPSAVIEHRDKKYFVVTDSGKLERVYTEKARDQKVKLNRLHFLDGTAVPDDWKIEQLTSLRRGVRLEDGNVVEVFTKRQLYAMKRRSKSFASTADEKPGFEIVQAAEQSAVTSLFIQETDAVGLDSYSPEPNLSFLDAASSFDHPHEESDSMEAYAKPAVYSGFFAPSQQLPVVTTPPQEYTSWQYDMADDFGISDAPDEFGVGFGAY